MRAGVVLAVVVVALVPASAAAASSGPAWPMGKLLHRLDGAPIHVGKRMVRVKSDTTICAGQGAVVRRHGVRMWRRFACTYTTFTRGGVDRDIDFEAQIRTATRFVVKDAHWVGVTR